MGCTTLFERADQEFEPYFLGRSGPPRGQPHLGTPFQTITESSHELLYYTDHFDYFLQSQPNKQHVRIFFDELLRTLRPNVIHFHPLLSKLAQTTPFWTG